MSCPYENHTSLKQLPCHWVEHPYNPELRICDICRQSYDVNDIDRKVSEMVRIFILGCDRFYCV
jgi:hypothetical protein